MVGVFEFSSGVGFGGQGLAAVPLAEARKLMDRPYFQISVVARDRAKVDDLQTRLQRRLGNRYEVQTPSQVGEDFSAQIEASTILYFFSGVALFVGGFLILNSFNMTVLQRMRGSERCARWAPRRMVVRTVMVRRSRSDCSAACSGSGSGSGWRSGLVE